MNNQAILNLQLACKNLHKLPAPKKFKLWVHNIFLMCKKKLN